MKRGRRKRRQNSEIQSEIPKKFCILCSKTREKKGKKEKEIRKGEEMDLSWLIRWMQRVSRIVLQASDPLTLELCRKHQRQTNQIPLQAISSSHPPGEEVVMLIWVNHNPTAEQFKMHKTCHLIIRDVHLLKVLDCAAPFRKLHFALTESEKEPPHHHQEKNQENKRFCTFL